MLRHGRKNLSVGMWSSASPWPSRPRSAMVRRPSTTLRAQRSASRCRAAHALIQKTAMTMVVVAAAVAMNGAAAIGSCSQLVRWEPRYPHLLRATRAARRESTSPCTSLSQNETPPTTFKRSEQGAWFHSTPIGGYDRKYENTLLDDLMHVMYFLLLSKAICCTAHRWTYMRVYSMCVISR